MGCAGLKYPAGIYSLKNAPVRKMHLEYAKG
jgi:hypothetical protein